jgi:anti-sigma factor RsiW
MLILNAHLTEGEVLLYADGELGSRRTAQIRAHLSVCWDCRVRLLEVEATIAEFMRAKRQYVDSQLPPIEGSRALLRARLSEAASKPRVRSQRWFIRSSVPEITAASLLAVLLILAVSGKHLFHHFALRTVSPFAGRFELGVVPNPVLTPGATRTVTVSGVCSMVHEHVVAEVSPQLQREVFQEYGIVNPQPNDYEIDYLIAPGLGGTEDIHNLWPQPYTSPIWNAYVKNSLEEQLHQLVCAGQLDLSTAQHDIATDWIAAYKKYFHTDRPLPETEPKLNTSLPILRS